MLKHDDYFSVSPWALTWDDENYYLIAFDDYSKTCKHYRVDKMLKLEVTKEAREGKEVFNDFDMAAYSKATLGMYHDEKKKVKIQCHNHMAGVFFDRFGRDISFRAVVDEHSEFSEPTVLRLDFWTW